MNKGSSKKIESKKKQISKYGYFLFFYYLGMCFSFEIIFLVLKIVVIDFRNANNWYLFIIPVVLALLVLPYLFIKKMFYLFIVSVPPILFWNLATIFMDIMNRKIIYTKVLEGFMMCNLIPIIANSFLILLVIFDNLEK